MPDELLPHHPVIMSQALEHALWGEVIEQHEHAAVSDLDVCLKESQTGSWSKPLHRSKDLCLSAWGPSLCGRILTVLGD